MTAISGWQEQQGGLSMAVHRVDASDPAQLMQAQQIMSGTFQAIAKKHGALFDERGLHRNVNALIKDDIHVDLYYAQWKRCAEEVCIGGVVGWRTYDITRGGVLVKAEYTEDMALPGSLLRPLIRLKPYNCEFPEESLAEILERISLQKMQAEGVVFRFGEVDPTNTTMMRQLNGNKAIIRPDSAILEFKRLPNNLSDRFPMEPAVIPISNDGVIDNNSFQLHWEDSGFVSRTIVTKGQATASGTSRMDLRPRYFGKTPSPKIMEDINASSLLAAKREAEELNWGEQETRYPSIMLPLFEARPDVARAIYPGAGNEITIGTALRPKTIEEPVTEAHVIVDSDGATIKGYQGIGGEERFFGGRSMMPAVNIIGRSLAM